MFLLKVLLLFFGVVRPHSRIIEYYRESIYAAEIARYSFFLCCGPVILVHVDKWCYRTKQDGALPKYIAMMF